MTVNAGTLWLVDRPAGRVRRYDGGALLRAGASGECGGFALHPDNAAPGDLVTDGGAVRVTDETRAEVYVSDVGGVLLGRWRLDGDNAGPCTGRGDVLPVRATPLRPPRHRCSPG